MELERKLEKVKMEIDEIGERYESLEAEIRNGWKKECDRLSKANAALWQEKYNLWEKLKNYIVFSEI